MSVTNFVKNLKVHKLDYKIKISVFRAIKDVDKCERYLKGHMQVMIDYNVMKITSYNKSWTMNPSAYVLIAENVKTGEMVGGIRVEVAKGLFPLPIETAIGAMDPRIYDVVKHYALNGGVGELCGLWNSKSIKGVGVSFFLTRAAIAIVEQLKVKTMIGICAEYTLKMFTDVGFEINTTLGNNGEFPYPDNRYITRSLGILNTQTLGTASAIDKELIIDLRKRPVQTRNEIGTKGEIEIEYDLILNDVDNSPYS
ncbi:MAG: hypothetical protein JWO32_2949 [Bacteroidetes bacterium]|nr:hypothetical protein [Bacteroidota bacterium]